ANLSEANLTGANLSEANLTGANLSEANLTGANLSEANLPFRVIQLGPIGSRNDYLLYRADSGTVSTGCYAGTLDEFALAVETTHGDSQHGRDYRAAIAMIRAMIEKPAG
ncbi:MAG: pentapeptide repeat-containing protein, partial [Chloroflexi bacterium]|nr:pentapeptide repeat-containing protein [Chloroflexota bacterium]